MSNQTSTPLVCNLTAIDPTQRTQHQTLAEELFNTYEAYTALADGFAFRFPAETGLLTKLAQYISLERRCCPFFHFTLELEADSGPLWLKMTGREGVKAFLQEELGLAK
jgi:hypothetical protein